MNCQYENLKEKLHYLDKYYIYTLFFYVYCICTVQRIRYIDINMIDIYKI